MFWFVYFVSTLAERSAKSGPATGFLYVPFLRANTLSGSLFADAVWDWFLRRRLEALLISVVALRYSNNLGGFNSVSIVLTFEAKRFLLNFEDAFGGLVMLAIFDNWMNFSVMYVSLEIKYNLKLSQIII